MCLNQVDHMLKPSLGHSYYKFQERLADHVFKPGLVVVVGVA